MTFVTTLKWHWNEIEMTLNMQFLQMSLNDLEMVLNDIEMT